MWNDRGGILPDFEGFCPNIARLQDTCIRRSWLYFHYYHIYYHIITFILCFILAKEFLFWTQQEQAIYSYVSVVTATTRKSTMRGFQSWNRLSTKLPVDISPLRIQTCSVILPTLCCMATGKVSPTNSAWTRHSPGLVCEVLLPEIVNKLSNFDQIW